LIEIPPTEILGRIFTDTTEIPPTEILGRIFNKLQRWVEFKLRSFADLQRGFEFSEGTSAKCIFDVEFEKLRA
jgi:hypothetical protein